MGTSEPILPPQLNSGIGAGAKEGLDSLLAGIEDLAFDEDPRVREWLEAMDAALLKAFWKAEAAFNGKGERAPYDDFRPYLHYRRGLLSRLRERGLRLTPDLLSDIYGAAGSPRLILLVTHACQLRCTYCRVRKFQDEMDPEVAAMGVRWVLGGLRRDVQIQFFGGEPLLNFPLIRKVTLQAEKLAAKQGKTVRFLVTTNGLKLKDQILNFFRDHNFSLEFSCDGMPETQLAQRKLGAGRDYYEELSTNLENLRNAGIDYQVISVITPENVHRTEREFMMLANAGHHRIQLNYTLGQYWTPEQEAEFFRISDELERRSPALGVTFVNASVARREPVVLNSELTVDCNGEVFRETGICLEDDFQVQKRKFFVTHVKDAGLFEGYGATQFDNMMSLVASYGRGEIRRTLLQNMDMGMRFKTNPPWDKNKS